MQQGHLVTPPQAVRAALLDYSTFTGRSGRSEFWWFTLASVLVGQLLASPGYLWGGAGFLLADAFGAATTLPSLAVLVRRLHDAGLSGKWLLVALTGIGVLLLPIFAALSTAPQADRYGPPPNSPPTVLQSPTAYPPLRVIISTSRAARLRALVWTALGCNYLSAYLSPQNLGLLSTRWVDLSFFGSAALVVIGLVLLRGTPMTPRLTRRPQWPALV